MSNCEKRLAIESAYKLTFSDDVNNLGKRANNKLRALCRVTPHVNIEKKKLL